MKAAPVVLAAGALLLLWLLPIAQADDDYRSLSGKVVEAGTGKAISGARVTVGTKSMVSDDAGFFKLDMPPGNYTITVTAEGYWSYTGNLSLSENLTRDIELKKKADTTACGVIWAVLCVPATAAAIAGRSRREEP